MLHLFKSLKNVRLDYRGKFVGSLVVIVYCLSLIFTNILLMAGAGEYLSENAMFMILIVVISLPLMWILGFSRWAVVDQERMKTSDFFYFKDDNNE